MVGPQWIPKPGLGGQGSFMKPMTPKLSPAGCLQSSQTRDGGREGRTLQTEGTALQRLRDERKHSTLEK